MPRDLHSRSNRAVSRRAVLRASCRLACDLRNHCGHSAVARAGTVGTRAGLAESRRIAMLRLLSARFDQIVRLGTSAIWPYRLSSP